jgi:hypothetical protein
MRVRHLLLLLLPLLASCQAGSELLRVEVQSEGTVTLASNGNQTVIASDGNGHLAATIAQPPFLPVYPPESWDGTYVRVLAQNPEYDRTFEPDELMPAEAEAIVRAVMTTTMIQEAGIRFESGGVVPPP